MKATGIVRKIDDLGRIVVPKEIRSAFHIREGDLVEICAGSEGEIVLRKYSAVAQMEQRAQDFTEALHRALGHSACLCDRDDVVAATGPGAERLANRRLSPEADQLLRQLSVRARNRADGEEPLPIAQGDAADEYRAQLFAPILSGGGIVGGLILLSKAEGVRMGDTERKATETVASIIGLRMEW